MCPVPEKMAVEGLKVNLAFPSEARDASLVHLIQSSSYISPTTGFLKMRLNNKIKPDAFFSRVKTRK